MKTILSLIAPIIFLSINGMAAKDLGERSKELIIDTEKILRLSRPELEGEAASKLSPSHKQALKEIAFNKSSDLQVRWRALVLAARLLGADAKDEVLAASKSSEWFMRSAALMAASELSSEEAAVLARKLVNDKALVVRSAAVDVLGGTGEDSDRQLLWKIIRDPINVRKGQSLWIRSQALQILAKNPSKKEISEYISTLKEGDLELQAISIHALEKAADFQFGSSLDSIEEHRKRWLTWWDSAGKTKSF